MSRSILFIAYFYPPCPDAGAHRPAAMVKYLRRLGHRVTVLTTAAYGRDAGDGVVRTADLQLARARMHGKDRVQSMYDGDTYSARPHPLSRVVVPEPLLLAWVPFALPRALRLHRAHRFDAVITSSPPESAHVIGRALARRGVAWVADVRDAWGFEPLRPRFPTAAQRALDERLERRLLRAADVVTSVSRPAADDLRARVGANNVELVPNGWDPELAPPVDGTEEREAARMIDPERTSLVYTGRFGSHGRDPRPLIAALRRLAESEPELARGLELVVAGPHTDAELELLRTDVAPAKITVLGSLPRARALALQRAAGALLLIASPSRSQLANLKLFEYLAAARPILALAAGTEAGRIVAESGGQTVRSDDTQAIAAALRRLLEGNTEAPDPARLREYSYPPIAERMARAVESAIATRSASRNRPDPILHGDGDPPNR